jgi:hypothetical protein
MSIEEPGQANGPHPEWVGLVARIRAGDEEAVVQLEDTFRGGIRLFLRRALGQHELENRQREVLRLVIESLRTTAIDDPNRLVSCVLTALRQYVDSQTIGTPYWVPESESHVNAIRESLDVTDAVETEALRRFYVGMETEEQICQALHITPGRLRAMKNTVRAGVRLRLKS